MSVSFPDLSEPWQAVRVGRVFTGEIDAERLPRLMEVADAVWPGRFELRFGRDEEERAVVTGFVRLTLSLICQRCMGELVLPVDAEIRWGLLHSDAQASGLPERLDPVVVDGATFDPWALLEDELLLAIPQAPRHPKAQCQGAPAVAQPLEEALQTVELQRGGTEKENPFAVLAALKAGRSGEGSNDT